MRENHCPPQQQYIVEEARSYGHWECHDSLLFAAFTIPVRLLLAVMTALTLVWDVMFMSTALFYHSLPEKVVGVAVALAAWIVFYRGIYRIQWLGLKARRDEDMVL